MKRTFIAAMAVTAALSSSLTAFAAPETMADGTVFDAEYYAQNNPDVVAVLGNDKSLLYKHYMEFGKSEGRQPFQPTEATPLSKNNNTAQNNLSWTNLPRSAYTHNALDVIYYLTHGRPSIKYMCTTWTNRDYKFCYKYKYDANGKLTALYEYDENGGLLDGGAYQYQYDAYGRLVALTYHDDFHETYQYDASGRLILATVSKKDFDGDAHLITIIYEYDANGRLARMYSRDDKGVVDNYDTIDYKYDANGNLTAEYYGGGEYGYVTFEYDANGNLAAQYYHDSDDDSIIWQLAIGWSNDDGRPRGDTKKYEYDSNGNLTAEYTFNSDGASICTERKYEYDSNGNKVKEQNYVDGAQISYATYQY